LNSIKINFYIIQGYFSGEIFILLRGVGKACQILCTRVNLVDPDQHKNKNNYYYNFKIWLGVDIDNI